jgi:hypothetical protein
MGGDGETGVKDRTGNAGYYPAKDLGLVWQTFALNFAIFADSAPKTYPPQP